MSRLTVRPKTMKQRIKRWSFRIFSLAYITFMLSLPLGTFITDHAAADTPGSDAVNIIKHGLIWPDQGLQFGTCVGYFATATKDDALLSQQFYKNIQDLPYNSDPSKIPGLYSNRDIVSYIGDFNGRNNTGAQEIKFILQNKGSTTIPVIKFRGSDGLGPRRGDYSANSGVCTDPNMMMIPISNNEWRGLEWINGAISSGTSGRYRYMSYVVNSTTSNNTSGTLTYETVSNGNDRPGTSTAQDIKMQGNPDWSGNGGAVDVGTINGVWSDVSTIRIEQSRNSAKFSGDTYKKTAWNTRTVNGTSYSFYFLDTPGSDPSGDRAAQSWSSGRGCETPLPEGSKCNNGASNCVPFIAVQQALNMSHDDSNLSNLQKNINQLPSARATLYDIDSSGGTDCKVATKANVALNGSENAKIWLAYSAQNDAFHTIFISGDGNESPYVATYTKKATGQYAGGSNGCDGLISASPPGFGHDVNPGSDTFGALWTLYNNNCGAPTKYGTLNVLAIGGSAGELAFSGASAAQANNNNATQPKVGCDILSFNPLHWFVCPIIDAAQGLASKLDDAINDLMNIDVKDVFSTNASNGYHTAWGVFRLVALGVVVIIGLIMIISQATGVEIFQAYTIRSAFPKFALAVIFIPLSWEILSFLAQLSNDAGVGIRSLIYSPFQSMTGSANLGGGSIFVTSILGTGAALAFGWVGLLSFAVTAALAAIIAFAILVFRKMLIVFLVMAAPFAIACYPFPNTQKVWKFWYDTLLAAFLVFTIVSAFIAIGRAMAITYFYSSSGSSTINQLFAMVAYFAPYFLITTAFRLAGGFLSTIGGVVNDRSRGAFDRLRNFRKGTLAQRGQRFQSGGLFNPNSRVSRFMGGNLVNRVGTHVGAMREPGGWRMGFGAVGAARRANLATATMDEIAREDHNFAAQMNNETAMAAVAFGNNAQLLRQLQWFHKKDANGNYTDEVDEAAIADAIATGRTIRNTPRSQVAAAEALAKSGKVVTNRPEAEMLYDTISAGSGATLRAAARGKYSPNRPESELFSPSTPESRAINEVGGNASLRGAVKGNFQYISRSVGHRKVGRDTDFEALREMTLADFSSLKPWDAQKLIPSISDIVSNNETNHGGKGNRPLDQTEQQHFVDLLYSGQFSPYTNADQQRSIQDALSKVSSDAIRQAAANYSSKLGGGMNPNDHTQNYPYGTGGQRPGGPNNQQKPPGEDIGYL